MKSGEQIWNEVEAKQKGCVVGLLKEQAVKGFRTLCDECKKAQADAGTIKEISGILGPSSQDRSDHAQDYWGQVTYVEFDGQELIVERSKHNLPPDKRIPLGARMQLLVKGELTGEVLDSLERSLKECHSESESNYGVELRTLQIQECVAGMAALSVAFRVGAPLNQC